MLFLELHGGRAGQLVVRLEWDVAQQNVDLLRRNKLIAIEIIPEQYQYISLSTDFLNEINGQKRSAKTYIWNVRRIFVSTLLEKTCKSNSIKNSS